jgi:pyridoxine 5-phosphate synthase
MLRLHVNIDHVATLRNARGTLYPDPVFAAELCELAGADGITAHLREDRRHIRDDDIERLRHSLTTLLNLEMAATDEMIALAERVRPDVVTLVPERREELTTEGGLDVILARERIEKAAAMCARTGIKLSLFIEADERQLEASSELGARQVELHTGEYAHARGGHRARVLSRLAEAARRARRLGLEVAAGHGLTRANVPAVSAIPEIEELNIGHSVIADAVLMGLERAVRELKRAIDRGLESRGARGGASA